MSDTRDPIALRYELSRRRFLEAGLAGGAAMGLPGALARAADAPSPSGRPNVVLIVSDDQGWTDFGFMGHPHVRTPNLDKLAGAGALFPQAYVPAPLCRASLASLLTGQYPHQHGICCNDPPAGSRSKPAQNYQFMKALPTIPRLLAGRGYKSFQTGKYWEYHYSTGGFTAGMTTTGRHGGPGPRCSEEPNS